MAASETAICNLALSWLAGNRIASLDDDSEEGRLCSENYIPSRRAVLEEREWTFAVKRAQLTALAETPLFGYTFQFLVPSDSLYNIGAYDPGHANIRQPPQIEHVIEEDHILANIQTINIKYVIDIINTRRFSPLFDQTLAAHIAMNICIPLTENQKQFENMAALYTNNLTTAIASNSLQGTREMLERSVMEESRRMFVRPDNSGGRF